MWAGTVRSAEGPASTERQGKGELYLSLSPLELDTLLLLPLDIRAPVSLELQTPRFAPVPPAPGPQAFRPTLSPATGFPGSPAYRWLRGEGWPLHSQFLLVSLEYPNILSPPAWFPTTLSIQSAPNSGPSPAISSPETPSRSSLITTHFYSTNPYPRNGLLQDTTLNTPGCGTGALFYGPNTPDIPPPWLSVHICLQPPPAPNSGQALCFVSPTPRTTLNTFSQTE